MTREPAIAAFTDLAALTLAGCSMPAADAASTLDTPAATQEERKRVDHRRSAMGESTDGHAANRWWRKAEPPAPENWVSIHAEMTDPAKHWGLGAAIFISKTRRATGHGPTFRELFIHLLPESDGQPGPLPDGLTFMDRSYLRFGFRNDVAWAWRQQGWITWTKDVERSLRTGPAFRRAAAARQAQQEARARANLRDKPGSAP